VLQQLAEDTEVDSEVRRLAAVQLAGSDDPEGVSVLTSLADDDEIAPHVRRQAAMSLAERGIQAGVHALRRLTRDGRLSSRERALATSALADLGVAVDRELESTNRRRRNLVTVNGVLVVAAVLIAAVITVLYVVSSQISVMWSLTLIALVGSLGIVFLLARFLPRPAPDAATVEQVLDQLARFQQYVLRDALAQRGVMEPNPALVRGWG
jgi:HEAT repeat protein